ncbi:MAG: tetratricopeptide repeat protein [Bacteroidales bacterium]|nr:tetratricopeptide repeat protein [Bacteroidales bacterium]
MLSKRFYLLFSFIILTVLVKAQDSKLDSLKNLLKDSKGVNKLNILFKLSDIKKYEPEGIEYAKDAIDLSKKIDDKSKADALGNLGKIYYYQDQYPQALIFFKQSLELSTKINYTEGIFSGLNKIAQVYYYSDSIEQSEKISRHLLALAHEKDSIKQEANAYFQLGFIYQDKGKLDSALILMNKVLELRQKIGEQINIAETFNSLGQIYYDMSDYQKSIDCYKNAIKIRESINNPQGLAIAYYNFGRTHTSIGNYQLALEQFQKALKTFEQINAQDGIANSCNGIGMVYENLSQSTLAVKENETNYQKALEYYLRALEIFQKLEKKDEEGNTYQNIANVYSRLATNQFVAKYGEEWEDSLIKLSPKVILNSFSKSIEYYNKSLDIFKASADEARKTKIAVVSTNLGATYSWGRDWTRANKYLNEGLDLARKLNLQYEKVNALFSLGESNFRQKNTTQAEAYFLECAKIAKSLDIKEFERYCYERLSKLYDQIGEVQKAFSFHKLSVKIKDELFSEKSQKAITEMQTKYETEKKDLAINLQDSIIKRQKLTIIGAVVGAVLILLVALLMFKMFREKKKANRVLEEKNELITEQKKEITDSIRYASRIQRAILPSDEIMRLNLPEHFVLYLPRDIVSGDFFWLSQRGGKIVIVAADCTGHGVPGAFMSMLGVSFLYEIVNKEGIMQPGSILNYLRDHVKSTLSQTGKKDEAKDGMDISLCVFDPKEMKLEWAGAYNPLYLIRNGELTEYKANKMPIAIHMNDHIPFTNNEISVQKGDTFYISSDGYADQFGGTDGRKFMSKKYKEMLLQIWDKPMDEQKEIIQKAHLDWKGHHEQVDDILVMGVRVQ